MECRACGQGSASTFVAAREWLKNTEVELCDSNDLVGEEKRDMTKRWVVYSCVCKKNGDGKQQGAQIIDVDGGLNQASYTLHVAIDSSVCLDEGGVRAVASRAVWRQVGVECVGGLRSVRVV